MKLIELSGCFSCFELFNLELSTREDVCWELFKKFFATSFDDSFTETWQTSISFSNLFSVKDLL